MQAYIIAKQFGVAKAMVALAGCMSITWGAKKIIRQQNGQARSVDKNGAIIQEKPISLK